MWQSNGKLRDLINGFWKIPTNLCSRLKFKFRMNVIRDKVKMLERENLISQNNEEENLNDLDSQNLERSYRD